MHAQVDLVNTHGMLEVQRSSEALELELTGEWRALRYAEIDAALATLDISGVRRIVISTEHVKVLDLTGAWRSRARSSHS